MFKQLIENNSFYYYLYPQQNPYYMNNKDLNLIKVVLVEHKRTNKWLAEQLGKDPATVSKWCTNTSQPSIDMFFRIAELLGVDYTELIIKPGE